VRFEPPDAPDHNERVTFEMAKPYYYDFTIKREQSQILLTPKTQRAEVWCKAHLPETLKIGDTFIIAPEDFGKLASVILDAGLTVERT
jgi:hypothetical protein